MRSVLVAASWAGMVGVVLALACGPLDDLPPPGDPSGRVCYTDSDCVPDDCCGEGGGVVHIEVAPDCRGVQCSGVCPANQVNCGCGLPVCRNSRCQVAVNYADEACVP